MGRFLFGLLLFLAGGSMLIIVGLSYWYRVAPREVAVGFVRAFGQTDSERNPYFLPWWLPGADILNVGIAKFLQRVGNFFYFLSLTLLITVLVGASLWILDQIATALFGIAQTSSPWWLWWLTLILGTILWVVAVLAVWASLFPAKGLLGRARWARLSEVGAAGLLAEKPGSLYMGRFTDEDGHDTPHELFYHGDRHLLTIGPQRSGKGAGLIIPNLATVRKSMLVLDAKGELAAITAEKRRLMGSKIVIFNPFQHLIDTHPRLVGQSYNPLAGLDWRSPRFVDDAKALASAMVLQRQASNPFFDSAARQLVAFLIMWVCFSHSRKKEEYDHRKNDAIDAEFRNHAPTREQVADFIERYDRAYQNPKKHPDLGDVRKWLSEGVGAEGKGRREKAIGITKLCRTIRDDDPTLEDDPERGVPAVIKDLANRFAAQPTDGMRDVVSTAQEQLGFLYGSDSVVEWLSGETFDFRSMRDTFTTVYVILPSEEMSDYPALARIVIGMAFRQLQSAVSSRMGSVVFLLDEFLQLGRMEKLLGSYDQAAGLGVQLWPIVQHFARFKAIYGPEWENFVSGAGMISSFVSGDVGTAQELARLCGQMTIHVPSANGGSHMQGTGLTLYDDLLRMQEGETLLFKRGAERDVPGVPFPFKGYAPRYFEKGSRFKEGLLARPIGVD